VTRKLFVNALESVSRVGENSAAWRNLIRSAMVGRSMTLFNDMMLLFFVAGAGGVVFIFHNPVAFFRMPFRITSPSCVM